jgi:ribosomal protein RSM22 (predicted rRNA methylase)
VTRRDGALFIANRRDALAYVAVRLPATYAAIRASFGAIAEVFPDFSPQTMFDVGAGPATAIWAAADCWPALADAFLVEASPMLRACGEEFAAQAQLPNMTWRIADVASDAIDCAPRDLVTLAYVLNELAPNGRRSALERLWHLTADTMVIVEPGTPAGWQRILAARRHLRAAPILSRSVPMRMNAHCSRRTGAISPVASPALACIGKPRARRFRGRTRSSAMWRCRAGGRP